MVYFYVVIFLPLVRVAKFAPITSIIQLRVFIFSLSQYENNHILCFNDCGLPPPVQIRRKTRKKNKKPTPRHPCNVASAWFLYFFMTSYEVSESSLRPTEAVSHRRVVPYKAVVWKRNDELRRSPSCHLLFFHVVLLPKKFTEHKWGRVEDQHTLLTEVWSTFSPPIHHFRLQVHFEDLAVCKKQKQKKKKLACEHIRL